MLSKQLGGGATTTYSYDGNGNLTGSTGGPSFTYNTKNQTKSIGSDAYTYSGADQTDRVKVNTDTFVYTGLGLSAQTTASGTTHFVRCSCGLLNNERTPDGKKYYYLFDGLGTIVGMTDSTGSDVNRYVYDPYGNIISQQEQSGLNNPWKFAGGYLDSSTSLYKFGTRYYDPTLGRWTQLDSAGTGYVYAGDNPVNAVDPSGRQPCGTITLDLQPFFTPLGLSEYFINIASDLGPIVSVAGTLTWYGGIFPGTRSLDYFFLPPFVDFEQLTGVIPTGTGNITVIASGLVFLEDGTVCGFLVQGTFSI